MRGLHQHDQQAVGVGSVRREQSSDGPLGVDREPLAIIEGAQGGHKLARGYEPVATVSAHYIAHEGFRNAIAEFLKRERAGVAEDREWLGERMPFRNNG